MALIRNLVVRMSVNSAALGQGLGKISAGFATVAKAGAAAAAATAAAAAAAGVAGLKVGLDFANMQQRMMISLESLLGTGDAAKKMWGDITAFAKKTPFELEGVANAARGLIGVGVAADKVIPTLQQFGNLSSAYGQTQDEFNRTMLASKQIIGAGKAQWEDLAQVQEAGIPILQLLGDKMGLTVGQVKEAASQGKISAGDFMSSINDVAGAGGKFAGAMDKQSQTIAGMWSSIKDSVSQGFGEIVLKFAPQITGAMEKIGPAFSTASGAALTFVTKTSDALSDLFSAEGADAQGFAEIMDNAFGNTGGLVSIFRTAGQAILGLRDRARELWDIFLTKGLPVLRQVAQQALGGLRDGFNTVREAIDRNKPQLEELWGLFKSGVEFIQTRVWPVLGPLLATAFREVGNNIARNIDFLGWLVRAFKDAGARGRILWEQELKPAWDNIYGAFQRVSAVVSWWWEHVTRPAFNGVATLALFLWNNGIRPAFENAQRIFRVVAGVATWLWKNVFSPAFNGIASVVRVAWAIMNNIFTVIVFVVRTFIAPVIAWLWRSVFQPAFNGIANVVTSIWLTKIKPVFNALGGFISQTVAPAFKKGVDAIGRFWEGLRRIAVMPVNFVIKSVINEGIIDKVKAVMKFFKADDLARNLDHLPLIRFQHGGVIPGKPSAKDNTIIGAATGEYVMPTAKTRKYLPLLEAMRAGKLAGYENGGIVGDAMGRIGGAVGNIKDALLDPVGWLTKNMPGAGTVTRAIGGHPWAQMLSRAPKMLIDAGVKWVKDKLLGGGTGTGGTGGGRGGGFFQTFPNGWPPMQGQGPPWSPNTAAAAAFINRTWPNVSTGSYVSSWGDHFPKAIDAMTNAFTPSGLATGNAMAEWFQRNSRTFGTKYIIWNGQFTDGSGWGPYTGTSNPHTDHVHLSFFNKGGKIRNRHKAFANGGIIPEPVFGVGKSGRTYSFGERGQERVLPNGAGSGGDTYEYNLAVYQAANTEIDLEQQFARMELRSRLRR